MKVSNILFIALLMFAILFGTYFMGYFDGQAAEQQDWRGHTIASNDKWIVLCDEPRYLSSPSEPFCKSAQQFKTSALDIDDRDFWTEKNQVQLDPVYVDGKTAFKHEKGAWAEVQNEIRHAKHAPEEPTCMNHGSGDVQHCKEHLSEDYCEAHILRRDWPEACPDYNIKHAPRGGKCWRTYWYSPRAYSKHCTWDGGQ